MNPANQDSMLNRQVFVLIDTSVWRAQPLLRTPLGAALLYYVRRTDSKIALPEVVELEIAKQLYRAAAEARGKAENSFGILQQIMGKMPEFKVPSDAEVHKAIKDRFDELSSLIERVPFTLEHARQALQRVIDEAPPNGPKNQQFKDSAIWEAACELASLRPVLFVTEDKGFFEARNPDKGLAHALRDEINQGLDIRVFAELATCLAAIQEAAPALDREVVTGQLDEKLKAVIAEILSKSGWEPSGSPTMELNVFATENHSMPTISLKATYPVIDVSQEESRPRSATAEVQATATYNIEVNEVKNIDLDSLHIEWIDIDGAPHRDRTVFGRGALVIGHRVVPISISSPVEQAC